MTTWGWRGREKDLFIFMTIAREKKCSPASPQGLELNSQGCQSDQEFNSIYSVGRLPGASVSASGCCPEPAQAEQPESWICLACHAMRVWTRAQKSSFSLIYGNINLESQRSLYYSLKLKWLDMSFKPEIISIWTHGVAVDSIPTNHDPDSDSMTGNQLVLVVPIWNSGFAPMEAGTEIWHVIRLAILGQSARSKIATYVTSSPLLEKLIHVSGCRERKPFRVPKGW